MNALVQKNNFLVIIAISAMILTQLIVANHDQLHHHVADDCVVCKVVEISYDKVSLTYISIVVLPKIVSAKLVATQIITKVALWTQVLSRAPPAS
ncbi:MAG: hypothetical protein JKY84_06540 [Emcibacteraceae bacterium]|nr:hypothetical protein [Emcibacteraceae bacterium]